MSQRKSKLLKKEAAGNKEYLHELKKKYKAMNSSERGAYAKTLTDFFSVGQTQ
jgi:hypothetical protein